MKPNQCKALLAMSLLVLFGPSAWCISHPELLKAIPAPATAEEVRIYVDDVPAGQHWAVILQPADGLAGFTVNPGYVRPMAMDESRGAFNEDASDRIGRLSDADYSLKDSEFRLRDLYSANESVYVVTQVSPGKLVSVYAGGLLVFHSAVTTPAILIDGKLAPKSDSPREQALAWLLLPQSIDDVLVPALVKTESGSLTASTALLREHLQRLPPLDSALDEQKFDMGEGSTAFVLVRIHVDTAGNVTSTHLLQGSDPLASAAASALAKAHFSPFMQNGKAVEVDGVVRYVLSDNGNSLEASLK